MEPSPYPQQIEPSPVDSNGTEGTEIDEDAQEHAPEPAGPPKIDTALPPRLHSDHAADNDPPSVIHVPSGFQQFGQGSACASPAEPSRHAARARSPSTPEAAVGAPRHRRPSATTSPASAHGPRDMERKTPPAPTRPELDDEHPRQGRRASSLEDIAEALDKDDIDAADGDENDEAPPSTTERASDGPVSHVTQVLESANDEVAALRTALAECWTLCNTLANLSSGHRQRTLMSRGKTEVQAQAWRSCWRLCQELYDHKDEHHTSHLIPTLGLCRDFCHSLFHARRRIDEASDSVLRACFELNTHLYNTHDRNLPDAFLERTLDGYVTLCHQLMKLRTCLPQETDSLLRACWSLAEMLFTLRRNSREGRPAGEDLLGSAVQACWELCDLFREGWTQVRPDRNTPRPSQTPFGSRLSLRSASSQPSNGRSASSAASDRQSHQASAFPPETPVTVFDDTSVADSSPDSVTAPNILVLGPASSSSSGPARGAAPHHERWTSNASVLSDYSESAAAATHPRSHRSSSTATAGGGHGHLARLRRLLLHAGVHAGYSRASGQALPTYVESLPHTAFGTLPWQIQVWTSYRRLVTADAGMRNAHALAAAGGGSRTLDAAETAEAVRWLGGSEQWAWMRDLFRLVFGFGVDEAERRGGSVRVR